MFHITSFARKLSSKLDTSLTHFGYNFYLAEIITEVQKKCKPPAKLNGENLWTGKSVLKSIKFVRFIK